MQDEDIRRDLGIGDLLERGIGQPDGSQQIGFGSQVLTDTIIDLVHCSRRGDEGQQSARSQQIQRFGKKVIVDQEILITHVFEFCHLITAKGDIADGQVEVRLWQRHPLETCLFDRDPEAAVQRLQHSRREIIEFDGRHLRSFGNRSRHGTEKITDSSRRFEDASARKTQALHHRPHGLDDFQRGVMGIGGTGFR